jgi:hypothetical protein
VACAYEAIVAAIQNTKTKLAVFNKLNLSTQPRFRLRAENANGLQMGSFVIGNPYVVRFASRIAQPHLLKATGAITSG